MTADDLKALVRYDPDTGLFWWRVAGRGRQIGRPIGSKNKDRGYIEIRIEGVRYLGHRLAWFYMTGSWPVGEIDHRNNVTSDNRFDNLRQATRQQNKANTRISKNNSTGLKGVTRHAGRFRAQIKVDGKTVYLGHFDDPNLAHDAYVVAANRNFGAYANAG